MKKTRKRFVLEREVVRGLATELPGAELRYVRGGESLPRCPCGCWSFIDSHCIDANTIA
jgi:hypothetical protein